MKSIRIDRDRALKSVALAALVLLTVTFLPDLLRSPRPSAVPANVGFAPRETSGFPPPADPMIPADRSGAGRGQAIAAQGGKRGETAERQPRKTRKHKARGKHRLKARRNGVRKAGARPKGSGRDRSHRPNRSDPADAPPNAATPPVPSSAGPAPAAPPPAAVSPPPAAFSPSPAGDGSREFTPR